MKWQLRVALGVAAAILATGASAAEKKVTLATLEWEPYAGSTMTHEGLATEVVRQAFERAGYRVEVRFLPWAEALELGRTGQVDGVFPAYRNEDRREHFIFSEPIAASPLGLYKKKTYTLAPGTAGGGYRTGSSLEYRVDPRVDATEALRGLQDHRFGVVEGYVNTPEFDDADFLTKVESPTDEENLKKLFRGEVDAVVIDKYVAQNIVAERYRWRLGEFEFMEPPLGVRELYVAVSRRTDEAEQIVRDFNAGLAVLREDGLVKRILARYGF